MRRAPGERWACEACGEPLIGALTVKRNVAPVSVKPKPNGNVWLGRSAHPMAVIDGAWTAVEQEGHIGTTSGLAEARFVTVCLVLSGPLLDKARAEGMGLHLNHFADCPRADRFRGG